MSGMPRLRSGLEGIVWPPVPVGEAATLAALVGRLQASERLPLARDRGGAGRAARPPGGAPCAPFAGVRGPARGRRARGGALDSVARLRDAAAAVAPAAAGRGQGLLRRRRFRAGTSRWARSRTSGSTGEPVRLRKTARRPPVLGRLHDPRPPLARPRLRRPDDLDPADQSALHRDGGLGLPGRRPVRDRQGAGDAGHDRHRRAGRRDRPLPAGAPALLSEQPQGARRPLGGAARGPAGEHPPPAHRRRDALGPTCAPASMRMLGLPIEDNYSSQEAGIIALQCPGGRALSHDGRVAGGRGARRRRAGPAPRARSAGSW